MDRKTPIKLLVAAIGIWSETAVNAQVYTQPTTGVQNTYTGTCMVTTCSGTFYDDGGAAGNYSANVNSIFRTFCPNTAGMCMRATFTSFSMNDQDVFCFGGVGGFCCDYLQILNGPVQNSPALYNDCILSPGTVTASNPSGCLTFRFTSDGSIQLPGWTATLSCVPCASGPAGGTNSDCAFATPVCADSPLSDASPGPGISAEGCAGCVTSENYTNWYRIQIQTSGTLSFTINPNNNSDDFDPVVFGPNVSCATLGAPQRCSYAVNAGNGNTGLGNGALDNTEDVLGDQWVAPMNVTAGQTYYVMINGWSATSGANGFLLDWTGTASLNCVILPVEFSSLHGACEGGKPVLRWTTASEHANSGFFVQRSSDGVQWRDIGWVNGAGNSAQARQYMYVDPEPVTGKLTFYRLRQIDMDGVEELTEMVYVKECDAVGAEMRLVPNPAGDMVTAYIMMQGDLQGPVSVEFQDALGRIVQRRSMTLGPDQASLTLDISGLYSGAYTVSISHSATGQVLRSRLIKR